MRRRIKTTEVVVVKAAILKKQGGRCALCEIPVTLVQACLDHNHSSGLIRGVLCRNCNGIEGKVANLANRAKRTSTTKDWLGRLILYWIKHETDQTGLYHPLHKTDDEKRLLRNKRARQRRAEQKAASA
ncbi:endonuclease domain-containing protein [Pannonibacter sp. SL95]|uniref:endonuclease domain-containing protein n=1 Tax=Pannonibacter sp. SL95 TaxID=2995153 RepID=UPI00227419DE|nr:endonuclease domain-containing protein [Pannonibacter sp. SL95]MCY1708369.1 endonuclease domain-containing protein [Pannonibacter sp. SL95]